MTPSREDYMKPAGFRELVAAMMGGWGGKRRQKKDALQANEQWLRAIFDGAEDSIFIKDRQLRYVEVNPIMLRRRGLTREQMVGRTASEVFDPEAGPQIESFDARALAGEIVHQNITLTLQDGPHDLHVIKGPLRDAQGNITGVFGISRDVTERNKVEERLRRSEKSLRDIFEAAKTVSFITTDLQGAEAVITEFSTGAEHIFGYRREEVIGQPLARLHLPEQVAAFPRVIEKMRTTRKSLTAEMTLVRKSGEPFPALLTTYPLFDSADEMTGVLGVSIDITERRQTEEDLRQSRDYLNSIVNGMHEGLMVVGRDMIVRDVNESLTARCGLTKSQTIGRSCHEIMCGTSSPCSEESRLCPVRLVFKTGVPVRTEHTQLRPNGRDLIADTYTFPLFDTEGHVELAVHIQDDVTERIRMERIRRQSEKLAATGRMAAGVAHEINNPLAGIKYSFLLIKDAVPQDHPYYEYVGRIESEIERIARIVRNMYDLYSPEREKSTRFGLGEAVDDVVALLQPRGRERKVALDIEMPSQPVQVRLPKGAVFQVLFNVVQNAIDASPSGEVVKIVVSSRRHGTCISVIDRGTGISEEVQGRIFEPFFTTKHNQDGVGLGLGLSVSRSLVEAMGGTLDFETEPGKGTVFHIRLPGIGRKQEEQK